MKTTPDRRRSARQKPSFPCWLKICVGCQSAATLAQLIDYSEVGVRIVAAAPVQVGKLVRLSHFISSFLCVAVRSFPGPTGYDTGLFVLERWNTPAQQSMPDINKPILDSTKFNHPQTDLNDESWVRSARQYFFDQFRKLHPDVGGNPRDFMNALAAYRQWLTELTANTEPLVGK